LLHPGRPKRVGNVDIGIQIFRDRVERPHEQYSVFPGAQRPVDAIRDVTVSLFE
jgi:hypothetical protein